MQAPGTGAGTNHAAKKGSCVHYSIVRDKWKGVKNTMQIKLSEKEALAAKVAMIRRYIMAKPPRGTADYVMIRLLKYEEMLSELCMEEVAEYRHYPGSYYEPPTSEIVNMGVVEAAVDDAIDEAFRCEAWQELEREDYGDMMELMEDYKEVTEGADQ